MIFTIPCGSLWRRASAWSSLAFEHINGRHFSSSTQVIKPYAYVSLSLSHQRSFTVSFFRNEPFILGDPRVSLREVGVWGHNAPDCPPSPSSLLKPLLQLTYYIQPKRNLIFTKTVTLIHRKRSREQWNVSPSVRCNKCITEIIK